MQAAPKALGQVPYFSAYPRKQSSNPSRQPLPQSNSRARCGASSSLCRMAIAASIVLAPLAILNVGVKVMGAENAYAIQRLESQVEEQTVLTESLRVENAKMASLERIKRVALDKLAMVEPNAQATIISMPGADVTSPEYASLIVKEVR